VRVRGKNSVSSGSPSARGTALAPRHRRGTSPDPARRRDGWPSAPPGTFSVGRGHDFKKSYQITRGGECVALVADMAMARAITECRPPGCYRVEEVEIGSPISRRESRARRRPTRPHVGRCRSVPTGQPSGWNQATAMTTIQPVRPNAR